MIAEISSLKNDFIYLFIQFFNTLNISIKFFNELNVLPSLSSNCLILIKLLFNFI